MKRGLVLSGGAAWGLANIGVLQVLEREKFLFDSIAGSSMGAIVAGAYALGLGTGAIARTASQISLLKVARVSGPPFMNGLHAGFLRQELENILFPLIGSACIGDCSIPFVCVAGKVSRPVQWERILLPGFTEHFFECITPHVFADETRMIDALLASSAIPVIFAPVKIGQDTFVDFVHFGALPARQLRALHSPDRVIGTDTNPRYGALRRFLPSPWREFMDRGHREIENDRQACDLIIQPKMPAQMFRFDRADDFIEAGRVAAAHHLKEIHSVLAEPLKTVRSEKRERRKRTKQNKK